MEKCSLPKEGMENSKAAESSLAEKSRVVNVFRRLLSVRFMKNWMQKFLLENFLRLWNGIIRIFT
jgi:hypothetical protein